MTQFCPACERGLLVPTTGTETLSYGGKNLNVEGIEFSTCQACHEDIVSPEQAKRNDVRFADAKRVADNLLTSREIKSLRESWNLTQAEASKVFGGGQNAFSKYER